MPIQQGEVTSSLFPSIWPGYYKVLEVILRCLNVHRRRKRVAKVDVGIHPELVITDVDLVVVA